MKQALIDQLETVFSGLPWYGDSMLDILEKIPPTLASVRVQDRSMLLYLRHILVWREFTLRQLLGETSYTVEIGGELDWPIALPENESEWALALAQLKESQEHLLDALRRFPEERLPDIIPGRSFSFEFLVNGIAQHDIYHLGQISLLLRLAEQISS
jgi:uncharacterized damage-inducible protein DinB